jgi:hypothetical protein
MADDIKPQKSLRAYSIFTMSIAMAIYRGAAFRGARQSMP